MRIITLQPSEHTDHITEDGTELTKLPYPFHVNEEGAIQRQDFWRGKPKIVIGFVADLNRQEVDVHWVDAVRDPERVVGMYVITGDKFGQMGTHLHAIASVTISDEFAGDDE